MFEMEVFQIRSGTLYLGNRDLHAAFVAVMYLMPREVI